MKQAFDLTAIDTTTEVVCGEINLDEILEDSAAANELQRTTKGCRYIELCEWSRY